MYSIKRFEKAGLVRYAEGCPDEKMTFHISEMGKIYLYGAGGHGKVTSAAGCGYFKNLTFVHTRMIRVCSTLYEYIFFSYSFLSSSCRLGQ